MTLNNSRRISTRCHAMNVHVRWFKYTRICLVRVSRVCARHGSNLSKLQIKPTANTHTAHFVNSTKYSVSVDVPTKIRDRSVVLWGTINGYNRRRMPRKRQSNRRWYDMTLSFDAKRHVICFSCRWSVGQQIPWDDHGVAISWWYLAKTVYLLACHLISELYGRSRRSL